MLRAADIGLRKIARGAVEAGVQDGFRRHQRKRARNRGLTAVRFHVRLPRPVTAFASGAFGRLIAAGDALVMWILIEFEPYVRVTGLTHRAAGVVICRHHWQAWHARA